MQNENTQRLAEKIARLLDGESATPDFASMAASIERINERLDKLESSFPLPQSTIRIPQSTHPSQEKFAVIEAVADEIFAGMQKEKACTFEPNGKPCDHCSMCSSRGF